MKGTTYFRWWGLSINEGEIPNIHISWYMNGAWYLFFYICLSKKLRWSWAYKKRKIENDIDCE